MSYIKRLFEDEIYSRNPVDAFDWLLDMGWDENDAREFVDMFCDDY